MNTRQNLPISGENRYNESYFYSGNSGNSENALKTINAAIDSLNRLIFQIENSLKAIELKPDTISSAPEKTPRLMVDRNLPFSAVYTKFKKNAISGIEIQSVYFEWPAKFTEQCQANINAAHKVVLRTEITLDDIPAHTGEHYLSIIDPVTNRPVAIKNSYGSYENKVQLLNGLNVIGLQCELFPNKLYQLMISTDKETVLAVWIKSNTR